MYSFFIYLYLRPRACRRCRASKPLTQHSIESRFGCSALKARAVLNQGCLAIIMTASIANQFSTATKARTNQESKYAASWRQRARMETDGRRRSGGETGGLQGQARCSLLLPA